MLLSLWPLTKMWESRNWRLWLRRNSHTLSRIRRWGNLNSMIIIAFPSFSPSALWRCWQKSGKNCGSWTEWMSINITWPFANRGIRTFMAHKQDITRRKEGREGGRKDGRIRTAQPSFLQKAEIAMIYFLGRVCPVLTQMRELRFFQAQFIKRLKMQFQPLITYGAGQ